jgi:hypoxanthine phosphoribosyltransferase
MSRNEGFRCQILSWQAVINLTERLAEIIKKSGYKPDIVIAIGRGGYIPARIVCDYLLLKDLTSIKVEHWGIAATETQKAMIKFPLCTDIKDKKILLIDDITDTGDTLSVSLQYLEGFQPKEIKTAVVIHKKCSKIMPDYFVKKVIKWRWIIFPWHLWEDLTGFIKKLKDRGVHKESQIIKNLKRLYNITVNIKTVRAILSEL